MSFFDKKVRIIDMKEEFIQSPVFDAGLPFVVHLAGISYCDGTYKIFRKNSKIACIEYVISGSGTIITNDGEYHPQKGDTYILLPNENHEYYSSDDEPWVKIWINVSGPVINAITDAYSITKSNVFHCNTEQYLRRIHKILEDGKLTVPEMSAKISLVFHALIQHIVMDFSQYNTAISDAQIIKDFIDTNIYRQISTKEMSQLIYKSPAHTIRLFKKAYGVTPYDYYMENRIKKAVSLLRDTRFSVKEIAFMLGFCDEHYFSNIFKAKTGKKPSEYR